MERIEKWKKEFIDMDDVVSDDDMLASLQKRLSGEGKEASPSLVPPPSLPPSLTSFNPLPSVTCPCPHARMSFLFLSASCLRFVYVASGEKIQDVEGLDGSGSGALSLSLARSRCKCLCACLCLSVSVSVSV